MKTEAAAASATMEVWQVTHMARPPKTGMPTPSKATKTASSIFFIYMHLRAARVKKSTAWLSAGIVTNPTASDNMRHISNEGQAVATGS